MFPTSGHVRAHDTPDKFRGSIPDTFRIQALVKKPPDWTAEEGDEDFEIRSSCFLTGSINVDDHCQYRASHSSPCWLENLSPVRHGISFVLICPDPVCSQSGHIGHKPGEPSEIVYLGIPFHTYCFQILRRVYERHGESVNLDGLWNLSAQTGHQGLKDLFHERVHKVKLMVACTGAMMDERLSHRKRCLFLIEDPLGRLVPDSVWGFLTRYKCWYKFLNNAAPQTIIRDAFPTYDKRQSVFSSDYYDDTYLLRPSVFRYRPRTPEHHIRRRDQPTPSSTHIEELPAEIRVIILGELKARDVANLRRAIPAWRQLPMTYFKERVARQHPWLWELFDAAELTQRRADEKMPEYMEIGLDWLRVTIALGSSELQCSALDNRIRIWKDMEKVKNHIARLPKHTFCQPSHPR